MKKTARTLSITAALAVMIPLTAYAATTSTTSTSDTAAKAAISATSGDFKGHGGKEGFGDRRQVVSQEVLDLLKLDKAAFSDKIKAGATLAEIAEQQGVSRESLKKAMTDAFNKQLEERKQEYADNLDKLIDSDLKASGHKFEKFDMVERSNIDLSSVATALGISTVDLKTSLGEGKSLADMAKEKGVDVQKVIDAIAASMTSNINQAVKDGKLTQDEATKRLAEVPTIASKVVNGAMPDGKRGGHRAHGFGGDRDKGAPDASETPSASAAPSASAQS
ncbi:hypothetical protein [Cohnella yongneupensis]|uniref:LysM domain-containing protein n=1 Tax=Cohnella yongneupensis TaxID=425006 RepID=A0ABW0QZV5_9BACL